MTFNKAKLEQWIVSTSNPHEQKFRNLVVECIHGEFRIATGLFLLAGVAAIIFFWSHL
jgi:hypothetical protein